MTANPKRGEFDLKVGSRSYTLIPSFQRLAKLEAALGRSLVQFAQDLTYTQRVTFTDVVQVIMTTGEPDEKPDDVGAVVVRAGIINVLPELSRFIEVALSGGSEGNAEPGDE